MASRRFPCRGARKRPKVSHAPMAAAVADKKALRRNDRLSPEMGEMAKATMVSSWIFRKVCSRCREALIRGTDHVGRIQVVMR